MQVSRVSYPDFTPAPPWTGAAWRAVRACGLAAAVALILGVGGAGAVMAQDVTDGATDESVMDGVDDAAGSGEVEDFEDPGDLGDIEDTPADGDPSIGLITAPDTARSASPSGAFSLAPERNARAEPRMRKGPKGAPPVVVELFTAQGCSSCPPADELIGALADQPGILTLSWHVDYWDYLGWEDQFARPENTVRQEAYAAAAGERGVYTPQIVVDGQDTLLSVERQSLMALIADHAARPPAVIVTATPGASGGFSVDLTPRAAIPGGVEVGLVRFLPARRSEVTAGENSGLVVSYRNIVVDLKPLATWTARAPLRLTVRPGDMASRSASFPGDTRHAILIQQQLDRGRPGPILAAIPLD